MSGVLRSKADVVLQRHHELADQLASADLDEMVSGADDLEPPAVAAQVVSHIALI